MQAPRPAVQYIGSDFFGYVFPELLVVAVGGSVTTQLIMQDDSDFELIALAYHMTIADAAIVQNTRPLPNVTIQLTDTGSGAALFNNPVPLSSVAYHGENGAVRQLPVSRKFFRSSTIAIQLSNFDAALITGKFRVTMLGQKLFLASR